MIVKELQTIQRRFGFLPGKELRALAARTGTKLYRIQEVASFFPHFRLDKPDPIQVRICQDMSCQLRGACELIREFKQSAKEIEVPKIDVQGVSCLGRCDRAPAALVGSIFDEPDSTRQGATSGRRRNEITRYYVNVDQPKLAALVKQTVSAVNRNDEQALPNAETDVAWHPDQVEAWSIDVYRGQPERDCYKTIRQFIERQKVSATDDTWKVDEATRENIERELRGSIQQMDQESQRIICSLFTANLLGMGGAGGRAYKKWFEVFQAKGDTKYIVCNADESEPGTFKDREILIRAPHLVIEAVTLAGLILGAEPWFHLYPPRIRRTDPGDSGRNQPR